MNKVQILFCLAFVACCGFTLTTSLKCYICDSSLGQNCSKPTMVETCNATLAQNTINYALQYTSANVSQTNFTSSSYSCLYDQLSSANSTHFYLGCAYSNKNICNFNLPMANSTVIRTCNTCSSDKCNTKSPADRSKGSLFTMTVAVAMAFIVKMMCI